MAGITFRHPDIRDLQPDMRVVVAKRTYPMLRSGRREASAEAVEVRTVEEIDHEGLSYRSGDGEIRRVAFRHGHFPIEAPDGGAGPTLIHSWCGSLPDAPDDQICVLHDAIAAAERNAFLVLVDSVDGDESSVLLATHHAQAKEHHYADLDQRLPDPVGEAVVYPDPVLVPTRLLPDGSAPGDLLVLADLVMLPVPGETPMSVSGCVATRLARGMDPEAVGRWMPGVTQRRFHGAPWHGHGSSLGALWHLDSLTQEAISRSQPDEAVIASVPSGTSGKLELHSLSNLGWAMHHETVTDHLWSDELPEGVWMWHDVSWRGCGEEASLEGDFRRATPEDLERHGLDVAGLDDEIAACMDREPGSRPGEGARLMALVGEPA